MPPLSVQRPRVVCVSVGAREGRREGGQRGRLPRRFDGAALANHRAGQGWRGGAAIAAAAASRPRERRRRHGGCFWVQILWAKKARTSKRSFFEPAESARGRRKRWPPRQRRGFRPRRDNRWIALNLLRRFDLRYGQYERQGDTGAHSSELQWHFSGRNYDGYGRDRGDFSGTTPFQWPPRQSTDSTRSGEAIRPIGAGRGSIYGAQGPFFGAGCDAFRHGTPAAGTISPKPPISRGICDSPRTADAQETRSDAREAHSNAVRRRPRALSGTFPTVRPPAAPAGLSFAVVAGCVRERWGARGPSRRRPARSFAASVRLMVPPSPEFSFGRPPFPLLGAFGPTYLAHHEKGPKSKVTCLGPPHGYLCCSKKVSPNQGAS